ncbi:hypothetical protein CYLTODRAFT_363931 [Cylindrobasidium torrendii FP15055 ss-10]|uniref:Uncharacterized protein n=1 Tax=Cylindrobasidium torrendii FP15055 ss-10 TaxID=1314674 RepID=A0A0D7BUT9_9AGAR|nr:hypothetical protein CYLTODRAFT_363931 [Cylindrobasidium torrendii FP15055 ss-10]
MEEPARRSSGIYYGEAEGSSVSLARHAASPGGSRFAEARPSSEQGTHGAAPADPFADPAVGPANSQADTAATTAVATTTTAVPWYKSRKFIISQAIIAPLGIALLMILLFPVVTAIAQLLVNKATIDISEAAITNPTNTSFDLALRGKVSHTGKVDATIVFPSDRPIHVSWMQEDGTETNLGTMPLHSLISKGSSATIDDQTHFTITDQDAFGAFAQSMITSETFTWRLRTDGLEVHALKFPVAKNIKFDKMVELKGFNSFNGNVVLNDLKLPSDNPKENGGGINFIADTGLSNPSPFNLNLGTIVFGLTYDGVELGTGSSSNTQIKPESNNIALSGFLKPHTDETELKKMGVLFSNYLNGDMSMVVATGVSTLQEDGTEISWLSKGLQALVLQVPFVNVKGAIAPIKTITIGDMALLFSDEDEWSPTASSNNITANMELPFGFSLEIDEIENNFNISQDGKTVAGITTPLGASSSNIDVLSSSKTAGTINITLNHDALDSDHLNFAKFNKDITTGNQVDFRLIGHAKAVAKLSIGTLTLDPIKFNVSSSLNGLQGLDGRTTIDAVDVYGGSSEGILLNINVTIDNPSNLDLSTGDLHLQLQRGDSSLGTALLSNLTLARGSNALLTTSVFTANANDQSKQTLNEFVGQQDVNLKIVGYDQSTTIGPLLEAFESLDISVILPGLTSTLLGSASLQVLSSTGRENNISHVTVELNNPWSATLDITRIDSTVSSKGINLGTISSATKFTSTGHETTTSPDLDLVQNLDPSSIFTLTRLLAVEAGEDPAPLDGIVEVGGIQYLQDFGGSRRQYSVDASLFKGFDLPSYVQSAFKKLTSDVELESAVTIGDYTTTLSYTQKGLETKTDDTLDYLLPILAQPIVQKIVDGSELSINTVIISDPKQGSFSTKLTGAITNAGPFDAVISFGNGLTVSWDGKPLGSLKMDNLSITGDVGGEIDMSSDFEVADVEHLTTFTKTLLTEESFEWEISGSGLSVSALGIKVDDVDLSTKKVTLKGMNGLKGAVTIQSFDLPENDPAGGIHLTINSTVENPSQVGISLDNLGFNTYHNDVMIALVSVDGTANLMPGSTSSLPLSGRLVPQESDNGLAAVSEVFNNFIHGKNSKVSVHGDTAGPADVSWLNDGIKALETDTELPNQGVLDIIKSIALNQMTLLFTEESAYGPSTSSNSTDAKFEIPFNFPIDITSLEQTITVSSNGDAFAELALPRAETKTDVDARIIHLTFNDVAFSAYGDKHETFNRFIAATTMNEQQTLGLSGSSNAQASTAVGTLSLTSIDFNVDSTIAGLQGLNTKQTTVANLDVAHGYADYLLITVDSSLFNPSNLTIGTDDVSFGLVFNGQTVGSALLNDLTIVPGNKSYDTDVHYSPQGGDATTAGQLLLANYIQGVDSDTTIRGSTDSTPIESLKDALSQISLSPVTIPAMHETLIKSADISFPLDIVQTGTAQADFTLDNPFSASINIVNLDTNAYYKSHFLGEIKADTSGSPIHADGHGSVTSQKLDMDYNLNPVDIINFLTQLASDNGVDLGPAIDLFQVVLDNPDYQPPVTTEVDTKDSSCNSGKQFDVEGAILDALAKLEVDLIIDSSLRLDDYPTDLSFNQSGVKVNTDDTALYLIGAVAGPIAQRLVDQAVLEFTEANITNISDDGFDLALVGSLTDTGPLDALIEFTEPVTVTWQDNIIATIELDSICAGAGDGVPDYRPKARLTITDEGQFTSFATYLLHNEEFSWTISTDKLRVTALHTIFSNVTLSKTVSFKAFNNLPGVTISNFELPSDDDAGGIHIETDALIPSPAQLSIDLGTVGFLAYYDDLQVGPLSANNLFLAADSETRTHLEGRITPKEGGELDKIGELFTRYLKADNITLITRGDSVQPGGNNVGWLTTAFKTLELEVTLPGEKFDIIKGIEINDFTAELTESSQSWAPLTGSNSTVATYANPFGFSLQVFESSESIVMGFGGSDIATLELPTEAADSETSTGNDVPLVLSWHDVPLQSTDNGGFAALFAAVTNTQRAQLSLKGSADVRAHTAIGDVPIQDIPFDVDTSLGGINGFGGTADLTDVSVNNGQPEYILATLTAGLDNPSNVTLHTTDIALPVTYDDTVIGRAVLDPFDLYPGAGEFDTEFHYSPADANDTKAQAFLSRFLTTGDAIPLTIDGDSDSTPYGALQSALSDLKLDTSLKGIDEPEILRKITVAISLETLITNEVVITFEVHNPLDTEMHITTVQSDARIDGDIYATFYADIEGFIVPPGETVQSPDVPHVLLVKGALLSLEIIPLGYLDISTAVTARIGTTDGGYEVPWLKLEQPGVPTQYNLDLGLAELKLKAASMSASSVSATASRSSSGSHSDSATTTTTKGSDPTSSKSSGGDDEPSSTKGGNNDASTSSPTPTSTKSSGGGDSDNGDDTSSPSAATSSGSGGLLGGLVDGDKQ